MPNLTLAIPEALQKKMKQHPDIRWSRIVQKTIEERIDDLEMMEKLTKKSKLTQKDVDEISKKIDSSVAKQLGLK